MRLVTARKSAAQNYARYRPTYPQPLIEHLLSCTVGNHGEYLVDWGAGTGELTLRLSPFFDRVTAVDHHPSMVSVARENAQESGVGNVEWIVGRAEDIEMAPESCDLITSASAFHWMDRDLLARRAALALKPDCALALVGGGGGGGVYRVDADWHKAAVGCVERHFEGVAQQASLPQRPIKSVDSASNEKRSEANTIELSATRKKIDPKRQHAEFLVPAGFSVEQRDYSAKYMWDIDEVIGYLYSVGFAPLNRLGDRRQAFEHELRDELERSNPSGVFEQTLEFYLIIARNCV